MIEIRRLSIERRLYNISLTSSCRSIAILGPNGAGKSTLLACLQGLIPHTAVVTRYQPHLLAQKPTLLARTLRQNLEFVGCKSPLQSLSSVGLEGLANQPCNRLSGGQTQLLALLMVLSKEPSLLLLDEPCAALDIENAALIEQLMRNQIERGAHLVFTTHSFNQARRMAEEVWVIVKGKLMRQSAIQTAFETHADPMTHLYLQGIQQ